jgi:hypothetical protein
MTLSAIVKGIESISYRHGSWRVFSDFVEAGAIALSNAVDWTQRDEREKRYLQIMGGYEKQEAARFPEVYANLVLAMDRAGHADILGRVFHELELHNKWAGQFFTPYEICRMMAKMTAVDSVKEKIEERGFIRMQEPCVGSGAMVIALAHELKEAGFNYQQQMHVTAVDVDLKCVCMAYIQLSLLHIPAIIVHGNTLTLETWSNWYTPAHIIGGWDWKLRRKEMQPVVEPEPIQQIPYPAVLPKEVGSQLTLF